MMSARNLSILVACSLLAGCSWFSKINPIEVRTTPEERLILDLKEPSVIKPKEVEWFIITPENSNQVFSELKEKKYDVVLYGLTDDGYENLSMNMAELRKYIVHQNTIIKAYKQYYEHKKKEIK